MLELLERLAARIVPAGEVSALLGTAFPGAAPRLHQPERRAGRGQQAAWIRGIKTLGYLLIYHSGLFHLVRAVRRTAGTSRACILLYHRVGEAGGDALTISVGRFAEHLLLLRRYYTVMSSAKLIEHIETGRPLPAGAVAIHFDDGYRDVFIHARPLLGALGFPAAVFVASGYIGTNRRFPHDGPSPRSFENLCPSELRELAADGFEIGSHTVNHVDLGRCTDGLARSELAHSKRDLEGIVGRPVTLFSFPYGLETNIRPGIAELVAQAGYRAMFSAFGGWITHDSHLLDLRRIGIGGAARPLDLLMEIEGLSMSALRRRFRRPRVGSLEFSVPLQAFWNRFL